MKSRFVLARFHIWTRTLSIAGVPLVTVNHPLPEPLSLYNREACVVERGVSALPVSGRTRIRTPARWFVRYLNLTETRCLCVSTLGTGDITNPWTTLAFAFVSL